MLCCLLVQSTVRTRYRLVIYWNHRYCTYTYTYINSVSVFDENAIEDLTYIGAVYFLVQFNYLLLGRFDIRSGQVVMDI